MHNVKQNKHYTIHIVHTHEIFHIHSSELTLLWYCRNRCERIHIST